MSIIATYRYNMFTQISRCGKQNQYQCVTLCVYLYSLVEIRGLSIIFIPLPPVFVCVKKFALPTLVPTRSKSHRATSGRCINTKKVFVLNIVQCIKLFLTPFRTYLNFTNFILVLMTDKIWFRVRIFNFS